MQVRRSLVCSVVGLLLSSWVLGLFAAAPAARAAEDSAPLLVVRSDPNDLAYLYRSDAAVEPSVAPPAPSAHLRAQTATISVEYVSFPPEARAAFQAAVEIWQGLITSPVPIAVVAYWQPLDSGYLGGANAVNDLANFEGAPQPDTLYPSALANKLAGSDLRPDEPDIRATFNSLVTNWYFGTGQTPTNELNFVSTVVHELGHGLGFIGTAQVKNGAGQWGTQGLPRAYDRNVVNGDGVSIVDTGQFPNPSADLAQQLQGNNLFWNGASGVAANGGNRPKLFAPPAWQQGSSYSHLDEATYPAGSANSLMTPTLATGETVYDPGPIALGILADIGWTVTAGTPSQTCFQETGKCIKGRFAQYWAANGGLAQQGFPITDEFDEVNPTDGKTYKTQYFERARFEYHPENQAPYDVLLGLLGREQLQAKYGNNIPAPVSPNPLGAPCSTFGQTGKQVCGDFLDYWAAHGGLAQQGFPLTDIFMETNPTDGKQYPTQYFERARFEYHVEYKGSPYVVLLGLLGREQFLAKYPNGIPGGASPSPSAPGAWGPTLAPLAGGRTYTHPNGRFTLSFPTDWQIMDTKQETVSFGSDTPQTFCSAEAGTVPPDGTLTILDQVMELSNSKFPNYQPLSKEKVVVRGQPAYRRVLSYTLGSGVTLQEQQVYFIAGTLFATLYCDSYPADFPGLAPTFDGIAGSITLNKAALVPDPEANRFHSTRPPVPVKPE